MHESVQPRPPLNQSAALRSFQTDPGLEVQLVAAEPDVTDPIALAFDEDSRLFVCEMVDYPYNPKSAPQGRIRVLEDLNQDGNFEKSHIFADQLHWPSGIAFWKGGLFVTAPPDIYYLKDADGDGVADFKQKVFTGFGTQAGEDILNNPHWGLDHRIYGVTSYNAGNVTSPLHPEYGALTLRNRDFRFDAGTLRIEAQSGDGDFGNTFDDFGHRFVCHAGTVAIYPVIPQECLSRNPFLGGLEVAHDIANIGNERPVYPISPPEPWRVARQRLWDRFVDTSFDMRAERFAGTELVPHGHVTGAAGITVYRGTALPSRYYGCAFTGEAANNLMILTRLRIDGASYVAERPDPTVRREVLASSDDWFRPVNSANAPDGCLYIADMYRGVIEDPSAIPVDILTHLDMRAGQNMGRIYRLAPAGFHPLASPHLSRASTLELVHMLEHTNGWQRDTAHRLLYERQDASCETALKSLIARTQSPATRICALWSLEGLRALDEADILIGLQDQHPGVREQSLCLAERHFELASIRSAAIRLAGDHSARVRFQAALTLGGLDDPAADEALASIARADIQSQWTRTALLCARPSRLHQLFMLLTKDPDFISKPAAKELLGQMALVAGARHEPNDLGDVLRVALTGRAAALPPVQKTLLSGLGEGLNRGGTSLEKAITSNQDLTAAFDACLEKAAALAARDDAPEGERIAAAWFLAYAPFDRARRWLAPLLNARQSASIQLAAVRALSRHTEPQAASVLLEPWVTYSPRIKREVVESLLARADRIPALLDALENSRVLPTEIDPVRRDQLTRLPDPAVRRRAAGLLASTRPERQAIIATYRSCLKLQGDVNRGEAVYQKNCAGCHRAGKRGHRLGPDFNTVLGKPPDWLLENILNPNASVQANYVDYVVETKDGLTLTGLLAEETSDRVTLRRAEDAQDIVLRRHIAELRSTSVSIMPEGLETGIDLQQMADLIAFIRGFDRP